MILTKICTLRADLNLHINPTEKIEESINNILYLNDISKENLIDIKFNTLLTTSNETMIITVLIVYEKF